MTRSVGYLLASAVALAFVLAGCGISRRTAFETIRHLPLREVAIDYEVPATESAERAGREGSGLSSKLAPALWDETPERLRLSIRYPHPELASRAFGLATLQRAGDEVSLAARLVGLDSDSGSTAEPVAQMTLERDELEYLIQSLIADGFFDPGERRDGPARIRVKLGRRVRHRRWDRVPALEKLIAKLQSSSAGPDRDTTELPLPDESSEPPPGPPAGTEQPGGPTAGADDQTPGIVPF